MNWYIKVIRQFFDFSGRATRKEYWTYTFINLFFSAILTALDLVFDIYLLSTLVYLYGMFFFIPTLAVLLRRLHDSGKSGWYFFLLLVPVIGWIWLLILLCLPSEEKPNIWGDNPKGFENDSLINQIGTE